MPMLSARERRVARPAYAKINLYLDALALREDGFHDLLTVMHSLSLHDDVRVDWTPACERAISMRVYGARLPLDRRNLAYRAAEALLDATGLSGRVRITIRKKIPIAAGLAGGSSDAAATLAALNEACGNPLPEDRLLALAATLGSDVPFCLAGGTRLCRGRGEVMEPLALGVPLFAVVAVGREHVSTPDAFRRMDAHYNRFDGSVPHGGDVERLCRALADGCLPSAGDCIYNAFEPVILPACPAATALRARLLAAGAYAACMSGSGPSVFGLFAEEAAARSAAAQLGPGAWFATSVV